MLIHFIQDIATPHNNDLLKAIGACPDVQLKLWYAYDKLPQYQWTMDLTNEIQEAVMYGHDRLHWKLGGICLFHRQEKMFIVGWANVTTRWLLFLSWFSRRSFNMWFDHPQDDRKRSWIQTQARELFYVLLKHSHSRVFCTGSNTVEYFKKRGFPPERLINLPIYNDISKDKKAYIKNKNEIFHRYGITEQDFFITSGSRLVYEKGFDIMLQAIHMLSPQVKERIKVLIVGKGSEKDRLLAYVLQHKLDRQVIFENWMDIEDFRSCIANSHLFIHPARFDAYGAGTLNAMIVGTPVVATIQSGSGPDRIKDGINGFLYDCADVNRLNEIISQCYHDREQLQVLGREARKTAEYFAPEHGAQIVVANIL